MSICDPSCTEVCIETGLEQLKLILGGILISVYGEYKGIVILEQLDAAYQTFKCKLPFDIKEQFTYIISQISAESSNAVINTNALYIVVIFTVFFLLVIFIYLTIYLKSDTATLIFLLLSLFIILIGAIVIYTGVNRIYSNTDDNIAVILGNLTDLLKSIECSGQSGLCCLASTVPPPEGQAPCPGCIAC